MKSEGTSVLAQNISAFLVGIEAYCGKINKYTKRKIKKTSAKTEIIFLIFIKSLQIEYIESVNEFMKLLKELIKKTKNVFIEIRGRENVLLEGYCRIELYSETKIILSSEFDRVSILGEDLNLCHLSTERMAVKGRIDGIEFI